MMIAPRAKPRGGALLGCRPDGAIVITPRWGYCDNAPMGLLCIPLR